MTTKKKPAAKSAAPQTDGGEGPAVAASRGASATVAAAFRATGAGDLGPATAAAVAKGLHGIDMEQTNADEAALAVQAALAAATDDVARISHGQALLIVAQLRAGS